MTPTDTVSAEGLAEIIRRLVEQSESDGLLTFDGPMDRTFAVITVETSQPFIVSVIKAKFEPEHIP